MYRAWDKCHEIALRGCYGLSRRRQAALVMSRNASANTNESPIYSSNGSHDGCCRSKAFRIMLRATGCATKSIGLNRPTHIQKLRHPGTVIDHLAPRTAIITQPRMENCHVSQFNIDGSISIADMTAMAIATLRRMFPARPYMTPITNTVAQPVTLCRIHKNVSMSG